MPGWIIQGVRGEGKSLCAVAKAREYLLRGCPVATNLDLFLDNLLPPDNQSHVYRLPDKPRFEDLALLPPAHDLGYKGEDKNGLIVLDELALWMNSRSWKEKGRAEMIDWLLLSRKDHWDLILLCQDHNMIDKQVKTTCCDYLVQASRSDRKKIPYLGAVLEFFFISGYFPKWHQYDVYYGLAALEARVDYWRFRGNDLYDGYDTNQRFTDGTEVMGKELVDMRATFSYLPASYLSGRVYTDRLYSQINDIHESIQGAAMAKAKNRNSDNSKVKAYLLLALLLGFLGWRYLLRDTSPEQPQSAAQHPTSSPAVNPDDSDKAPSSAPATAKVSLANEKDAGPSAFLDRLIHSYRPRLAAFLSAKDSTGADVFTGLVEFYEGSNLVERFKISELKAFGCAVTVRPYGVDIVTAAGVYPVTAWPRPAQAGNEQIKPALSSQPFKPQPPPESPNLSVMSSLGNLLPTSTQ